MTTSVCTPRHMFLLPLAAAETAAPLNPENKGHKS